MNILEDHEKHCNTKIPLTLDQINIIWSELDDKTRMEVLKSVIWTAPDCQSFYEKAVKVITSEKFRNTLD